MSFSPEVDNINPEFRIEDYFINLQLRIPPDSNDKDISSLQQEKYHISKFSPEIYADLSPKQQQFLKEWIAAKPKGSLYTFHCFKSYSDFEVWSKTNNARILHEQGYKTLLAEIQASSGEQAIGLLLTPKLVESLDASREHALSLEKISSSFSSSSSSPSSTFPTKPLLPKNFAKGTVRISGTFVQDTNHISLNSVNHHILGVSWEPRKESLPRFQKVFQSFKSADFSKISDSPFVSEKRKDEKDQNQNKKVNEQEQWKRFLQATSSVANPKLQTITIQFTGKTQNGATYFKAGDAGILTIEYDLILPDFTMAKGNGIYFQHGVLCTQFEPYHARTMFPCHDHPRYKARYLVRIVSDVETEICLSNNTLRHYQISFPSGTQTWFFDMTATFSTYLVALVLAKQGIYASSELTVPLGEDSKAPFLLRCFLPVSPSTHIARQETLKFSASIISTISILLKCRLKYYKLDLIGLPDLRPAAMENQGLITFRIYRLQWPLGDSENAEGWKDAVSLFSSYVKENRKKRKTVIPPSISSTSKPVSVSSPSLSSASSSSSTSSSSTSLSVPATVASSISKLRIVEEFENEESAALLTKQEDEKDDVSIGGFHWNLQADQLKDVVQVLLNTKWNKKHKRDVLKIIAHEIVHQWFGNLITCDGWDQIFWNEAFATYWSFYVLDKIYPEWKIWHFFIYQDYFQALSSEMQISKLGKQLLHPVVTSEEFLRTKKNAVEAVFDFVTYSKGSVLLRMVESLVGDQVMLTTLQVIFTKYQTKTMSLNLFLAELDLIYKQHLTSFPSAKLRSVPDLKTEMIPSEVIRPWFENIGFPTLNVRFANQNNTSFEETEKETEKEKEKDSHNSNNNDLFKVEICQCLQESFAQENWDKKKISSSLTELLVEPPVLEIPTSKTSCVLLRNCRTSSWKIPLFIINETLADSEWKPSQRETNLFLRQRFTKPLEPKFKLELDNTSVLTSPSVKILLFIPLSPNPSVSLASATEAGTEFGIFTPTPVSSFQSSSGDSGKQTKLLEPKILDFCLPGEGICGKTPTVWKLNSKARGYYTTFYSVEVLESYLLPNLKNLPAEERTHFHQEIYLGFRLGIYKKDFYIFVLAQIQKIETDTIVIDSILTRLRMMVISFLVPEFLKTPEKIREGIEWCELALKFAKPIFDLNKIPDFFNALASGVAKPKTEEEKQVKTNLFLMTDLDGYLFQLLLNHYLFFHYRYLKLKSLLVTSTSTSTFTSSSLSSSSSFSAAAPSQTSMPPILSSSVSLKQEVETEPEYKLDLRNLPALYKESVAIYSKQSNRRKDQFLLQEKEKCPLHLHLERYNYQLSNMLIKTC